MKTESNIFSDVLEMERTSTIAGERPFSAAYAHRPYNSFAGKWKLVGIYRHQDSGWVLSKRYKRNPFVWEFMPCELSLAGEDIPAFHGQLNERFIECDGISEYTYYPRHAQLIIERWGYQPEGLRHYSARDEYRVERTAHDEYRLYSLQNVFDEPDDYLFAIALRKIR